MHADCDKYHFIDNHKDILLNKRPTCPIVVQSCCTYVYEVKPEANKLRNQRTVREFIITFVI